MTGPVGVLDPRRDRVAFWAVLTGTITLLAIIGWWSAIGFQVVRSDMKVYETWSAHPLSPDAGTSSHLPGYPLFIAALRILTFGLLPAGILLQSAAWISWAIGVLLTGCVLRQFAPSAGRVGVWLFALFPFVGITYVAYPIADTFAVGLFVAGLYCLLNRGTPVGFAVLLAMTLLVHKALWPFVALAALWAFVAGRIRAIHLFVIVTPLVAYYAAYGIAHHDPLWLLRSNVRENLSGGSSTRWPLDALVGPLMFGTPAKAAKGVIVSGLTLAEAYLFIWCVRRGGFRTIGGLMSCLALPALIFALTLNQDTSWAICRFSRVSLAWPATLFIEENRTWLRWTASPFVLGGMIAALLASQCLYAYYFTVFYAGSLSGM
jgi:hypothetical protein